MEVIATNRVSKPAIVDLVKRVTQPDSPDHVQQADRIAVFDNDGTLWCEKPANIQGDFLMCKMAANAEYVTGAGKIINAVQSHNWTVVSIKRDWRKVFSG